MTSRPPQLLPVATPTQNACKMCAPLGASLAFRGIEGCIPLIHGSQGCATYIRRHFIGHFREPVDIASSSFTEQTAIFGGQQNLFRALDNVTRQYGPKAIGIATSCLSETLGEDVRGMLVRYAAEHPGAPLIIAASTPSYCGTHATGFHAATAALVSALAVEKGAGGVDVAVFPGFLSCADLRHIKEILGEMKVRGVVLPDYSETLDAAIADAYAPIPPGGTPIDAIRDLGNASLAITFGYAPSSQQPAGEILRERHGCVHQQLPLPMGIEATDALFAALCAAGECAVPARHAQARGRLVDSYVDAHKYIFGARVAVYGEESLAAALCRFVAEIGAEPVLCATGGGSPDFGAHVRAGLSENHGRGITVLENADFARIEARIRGLKPDLLIGDSHGYATSRELGIPLVRVGFPIHDRIGAQRLLHIGYEGSQQLFDRIVNALLGMRQDASPVGYQHM